MAAGQNLYPYLKIMGCCITFHAGVLVIGRIDIHATISTNVKRGKYLDQLLKCW
jgi:hypothetical protein